MFFFYLNELQISGIDYENYHFHIGDVIRKQGKYSVVSWVGWPKEYNSWVKKRKLKDK